MKTIDRHTHNPAWVHTGAAGAQEGPPGHKHRLWLGQWSQVSPVTISSLVAEEELQVLLREARHRAELSIGHPFEDKLLLRLQCHH
jgi:hypothetical protein